MIIFVLTVVWLATTANGEDKCKGELKRCLAETPLEGEVGLPASLEQITVLCMSYQKGMECVDSWNKECLPTETRLFAEKQMASAKFFMKLLCTDQAYRKEYLNHTECFGGVSNDWMRCHRVYLDSVRGIEDHGHAEKIIDLCCAKYGFNRCISLASRAKCDKSAAVMLRRISETLSHFEKCEKFDATTICSAASSVYELKTFVFTILIAITVVLFSSNILKL